MQYEGSLRKCLENFFSYFWNCIDLFGLLLFYVGLILRFIPNNNETFLPARYLIIKEKNI